jgi:hypothetical protein
LEKEEARKALQKASEKMESEMRLRERAQIELNSLKGESRIGRDMHSGMSYEALL